jgi:hypothetical protein
MKHKKQPGRILLAKDRVLFHKDCMGTCHVCGDWALISVIPKSTKYDKEPEFDLKPNLKLCFDCYTKLFRTPPNRQAPKPKVKKAKPVYEDVRFFQLRRTMKQTIQIYGERKACVQAKMLGVTFYFSLYDCEAQTNGYFITIAAIAANKHALHFVGDCKTYEQISSTLYHLIAQFVAASPVFKQHRVKLEVEASKIFDFIPFAKA